MPAARNMARWMTCAAAAVTGCAAPPEIEAVSAQTSSAGPDGTSIKVLMELRNPNDAPIELTAWNYTLTVGDRTAFSGEWIASLTLPPKTTLSAELPAFVPASVGDLAAAPWRVGGSLDYRATGKLDRLLYQLGVNRLSTGFGSGSTGVAPAAAAQPQAAPAAPPATPPAAPQP